MITRSAQNRSCRRQVPAPTSSGFQDQARTHFALGLVVGLLALIGPIRGWSQASFWTNGPSERGAPPALITNLAELRGLDRPAAKLRLPVRLQAVVTYCEDQWPSLFVQDGSSASYVFRPPGTAPLQAGDRVEIEGHSGEGFTPLVQASAIRKIGTADLPAPIPATLADLGSGRFDGLRVRLATTVRWMHVTYRRLYLHIGEASGRYEVHIPEYRGPLPVHLVGAQVELIGITGTKVDGQGHVTGAGMSLARLEEVKIVNPAPVDPWDRPTQVINTLMYFHPSTSFGQRTKLRGVLTLSTPSGKLYVEDASGGCEVRLPTYQDRPDDYGQYLPTARPPGLKVGDQVEVLGYPDPGSYTPILTDAILRQVGNALLPPAQVVTGTNVLNLPLDSRRIRLKGRVLANEVHPLKAGLQQRLTVESESDVFVAEFEGTEAVPAPVASQVEVTGICAFEVDERRRTTGFHLLIPALDNVNVLAGPPLITARALTQVGAPVIGLILGWTWMLRRQVRRRTIQLHSTNRDLQREVEQRVRAERSLEERVRMTTLSAQVAMALNEGSELSSMLGRCADLLVKHLGVASAQIWTLHDSERDLELQASTGVGPSQPERPDRLAVGQSAVGRIAESKLPRLNYPLAANSDRTEQDGATQERMVGFAGYPLLLEGRVLGVVALFMHRPLGDETLQALGSIAHSLALGIERKRTVAELIKALERERELGELKTSFVSMVSHEFRTPLEIILSSTDILSRYLDRLPETERAEHLAAIQHSVQRMSGMMEDVLLLGRFESERQPFRPDDVHLAALCRRLADEIRSATAGKCPILLSVADDLPLARVDASLLRHILINLLSNAVKYSPAGSPVNLSVTRDGTNAIFRIEDTGMGIPAADYPHLFEAFHRGRNASQIPGSGLGLVIVKRSVDSHSGQIEVTSREGCGTQFSVRLPLFDASDL